MAPVSYEVNFLDQFNLKLHENGFLGVFENCPNVVCGGSTQIHNEVRVLSGDLCLADLKAFKPGGFDKTPRMVALWIPERGAAAW